MAEEEDIAYRFVHIYHMESKEKARKYLDKMKEKYPDHHEIITIENNYRRGIFVES